MTEHEIQTKAVKELRKLGFPCCVTSNNKRTANTKGTPDVFVYVGERKWIGLEFKQPSRGRLTWEQVRLYAQGANYIIYSVDDALIICKPYLKKIEETK